jgi:hypothetical protein
MKVCNSLLGFNIFPLLASAETEKYKRKEEQNAVIMAMVVIKPSKCGGKVWISHLSEMEINMLLFR